MTDPISAIIAAVNFVFTSTSFVAQTIRFIGSTLITAALSGSKQPRLSDLKVQTSSYGAPIPRLYGEAVRVAGNVIDKSDLIPRKHKKGSILGIGGVKYYTYDVHVAVLIGEGPLPANALVRIFADGQCIFDRDAAGATAGAAIPGVTDSLRFTQANGTHADMISVHYYRGTSTQGADPIMQALHPGEPDENYRHTAYVVINNLQASDFGNRPPNLEFEIETDRTTVKQVVEHLGTFADVTIVASDLRDDRVRGYIVAQDGSVWSAIEPLAGAYAFDLYLKGEQFEARKRGRYVTTVIPEGKWAAQEISDEPGNRKDVSIENADKFPDAVTVTYLDRERDYQPNTQQASFNPGGYSRSKVNVEVPLVLTANEARNLAQRTLYEAFAAAHTIKINVSEEYRWLKGGDIPALAVGGNEEPFRIRTATRSPNGVVEVEASLEDPLLYTNDLVGAVGSFPSNPVSLPGDTIMQPVDGPIIQNADDDTGFYAAFAGTGSGWRGAEVYRALGIGSPLTFSLIGNIGVSTVIADCDTTLPSGPTDVWDYVSTLTVSVLGQDDPESATEEEVLVQNANLAWVGNPDTGAGEFINFATVAAGSPAGTFILSDFLRGRYGTEYAVGSHGSGERFVLLADRESLARIDFGATDWNLARTYKPVSLFLDAAGVTATQEFTNTGEGKRPLSGVLLSGSRDGSNNLTITWERRTRYQTGDIAAAVPLGEEVEAYEVDILIGSPGTAIRTITATTPSVSYTAAQQTADGYTPGDPIDVEVYQMSTIRGRGRVLSGTV